MQVNAINQFSTVNFEARKNKKAPKNEQQIPAQPAAKGGFMKSLAGPTAAAMFLIPIATGTMQSCDKIEVKAQAGAIIPFQPPCDHDGCDCEPGRDTTIIRDTIYIPPEFKFPTEIQDSLNIWRGDILDVPVEGDDGDLKNKALLYIGGKRHWEYNRPEYMKLNLERCYDDEARYDHFIGDDVKNDIRVTLVKPGEITVVKKDGTVTDQVSGLMFNEDGYKTFAHSNGENTIFVYPKAMDGENKGKFVELGTLSPGYLPEDGGTVNTQYGKNVLLTHIINEDIEDHFVNIEGKVMNVEALKEMAKEKIIVED